MADDVGIEIIRIIRNRLRWLTVSVIIVYLFLGAGIIVGTIGGYILISKHDEHDRLREKRLYCVINGNPPEQCQKLTNK